MRHRLLPAAASLALLPLAAPAAADEAGDVVATGDGRGAIAAQEGSGGREVGFVALLDRNGSIVRRELSPGGETSSLPGLARQGDAVLAAWRAGRVVSPSQALPPAEGLFSGRLDAGATGPVAGSLRNGEKPNEVQVVARSGGGHVLVWVDPSGGGVRTQAVSESGRASLPRAIAGSSTGRPIALASGRRVWVVLASRAGTLHAYSLNRAGGIGDDYAIEPEGSDGPYAAHDAVGDGRGGIAIVSSQQTRRGRELAITHVTNDVAYTIGARRARSSSHEFGARIAYAGRRALIAYTAPGGDALVQLGPTRRDLLAAPERPRRVARDARVEDLTGVGGQIRLLTAGRRGMALRGLRVRGDSVRAGSALDLTGSRRRQADGRVAVESDGTAYAGWEQRAVGGCIEVAAAVVRGRSVRTVAITRC